MPKTLVLGNGNILVCMDKFAQIRDFYYPYVGQENHVCGHRHKMGVWTENKFSWLFKNEWQISMHYKKETLVSEIKALNKDLKIELLMNDTVCYEENIYLRKIVVKNLENKKRNIRVFFNQHFNISEDNIGDTVYFDPTDKAKNSIIYYKGKRYFLINGVHNGRGFDDYATGNADINDLEGTYIDAEDGMLSKNSIEHGSVDSTIGFHLDVEANSEEIIYYWIAVGEKFKEVCLLNEIVLKNSSESLIKETEYYWTKWVNKKKLNFYNLNEEIIKLFKRSLLIIKTQTDNDGAIIAANDSDTLQFKKDTYSYMWPRDGALVARALDRAGYKEITQNFFEFCNSILTDEGYLFPKYRPDKSLGSSWHPWLKNNKIQLPIQEDQIGLVLDSVWKHYMQNKDKDFMNRIYPTLVKRAADFMVEFRDKETKLPNESYDLWEEKLGIHTYTCCAVYAGLKAAYTLSLEFGSKIDSAKYKRAMEEIREAIIKYLYDNEEKRFIKSIYKNKDDLFVKDKTIDSSTGYGVFEYNILDINDDKITSTMKSIIEKLSCKTSVGGICRYENDYYHKKSNDVPGNPWFITTLWLSEYYLKKAKNLDDLKPSLEILNWVVRNAQSTEVLSEQIDPITGKHLSVAPLTWSHGTFVTNVIKYIGKYELLSKNK
ncbi:MAG: glycoside hydrolase family 15 protein [archaeon]